MKICHIISSIDKNSGGTSTYLQLLANELVNNLAIDIVTINSSQPLILNSEVNKHFAAKSFSFLQSYSRELNRILEKQDCDIFHGNGLWQYPVHKMAQIARARGIPYILSPHGMLEPWALNFHKQKKKLGLYFFQTKDLERAACIHATSYMEANNIRKLGFRNPIAIIPNGINLKEFEVPIIKKEEDKRTLLFLSRIHPKKGIEILIEAWSLLDMNTRKCWQVNIAGNGDKKYLDSLQKLIDFKGLKNEIFIIGAKFGSDKLRAYQQADLFVLPTYSENFGIVIAEALACGLPVVTTNGTPWAELNKHNAGWCIEIGVMPLLDTLKIALNLDVDQLKNMGLRGRQLVEENYSIQSVGKKMDELYNYILNHADCPSFIDQISEDKTLIRNEDIDLKFKMKQSVISVNQIISSIDIKSGGPSFSVTSLCKGLIELGVNSKISTILSNEPVIPIKLKDQIVLIKKNFFSTLSLRKHVKKLIRKEDTNLIHCHGIWQYPIHTIAQLARSNNIPYIISPRGMLEPWALTSGKNKKNLALWLYQRKDLEQAICIHATSIMEAQNIKSLGFKNPIAVIPNGLDINEFPPKEKKQFQGKKTILFLSRIHQKKGIELLLEAWSMLDMDIKANWQIKIAGTGKISYLVKLKKLITKKGLENEISFIGPLSGIDKIKEYHAADIFILPTYSENFGNVIAEALACGVPVLTTKGTPWEDLETNNAGWYIEIGATPLFQTLKEVLVLSENVLCEMGQNGRKLIEERYSVGSTSLQMKQLYEWILNGGKKPNFIN